LEIHGVAALFFDGFVERALHPQGSHGAAVQMLGAAAGAATLAAFCLRDEKAMLRVLSFGLVLWTLHHGLLHAATAAAGSALSLLRVGCLLRWKGNPRIESLFCAANVLAAALTWNGPASAFALAAMTAATIGMNRLEGVWLRACLICVSLLWIGHHLLVGSMGGAATECALICANLWAISRIGPLGTETSKA